MMVNIHQSCYVPVQFCVWLWVFMHHICIVSKIQVEQRMDAEDEEEDDPTSCEVCLFQVSFEFIFVSVQNY